ncbi:MAG TPA: four helix bundle protein [Nevskiaceae bacterium]|nr:four helix bundle protein [Nevskiaceae bacterium]
MGNRESRQRPHERLEAWRDSMDLVEAVHRFSAALPSDGRHGLTAQLRGAAVSIPATIAQGAARRSRRDPLKFLSPARGSLAEADTPIKIACRLGFAQQSPEVRELVGTAVGQASRAVGQAGRGGARQSVNARLFRFSIPGAAL